MMIAGLGIILFTEIHQVACSRDGVLTLDRNLISLIGFQCRRPWEGEGYIVKC